MSNFKNSNEETRARVSIISTAIYEEILDRAYKFHPVIEKDEEVGAKQMGFKDLEDMYDFLKNKKRKR